jgi:thymidylate kinase
MTRKQLIVIFDGPDRTGKSEISRELSHHTGAPYYKNSSEWKQFEGDRDHFLKSLQYGATMLVDFMRQAGSSAIMDRFTPSEYVYSEALNRPTDLNIVRNLEGQLNDMGAVCVICRRKQYVQADDRYPDLLNLDKIRQLDALYERYANEQAIMPTLTLWVDDHNIERQLGAVLGFINAVRGNI